MCPLISMGFSQATSTWFDTLIKFIIIIIVIVIIIIIHVLIHTTCSCMLL